MLSASHVNEYQYPAAELNEAYLRSHRDRQRAEEDRETKLVEHDTANMVDGIGTCGDHTVECSTGGDVSCDHLAPQSHLVGPSAHMAKEKACLAKERALEFKRAKEEREVYTDILKDILYLTRWQTFWDSFWLRFYLSLKLVFLILIAGTEVDVLAFVVAFHAYWCASKDSGVVDHLSTEAMRIMLIVGVVGYIGSMMLYYLLPGADACCRRRQLAAPKASGCWHLMCGVTAHASAGDGAVDELLADPLMVPETSISAQCFGGDRQALLSMLNQAKVVQEPVGIKMFHCVPIFRMYLLIKPTTPEDVESLFRVNALSTFTLGLAQMSNIGIGSTSGMLDWNLFIKIGLMAQILNLIITFLFFFTPVCELLKGTVELDSVRYNDSDQLRRELRAHRTYTRELSAVSLNKDETAQKETALKQLVGLADKEITQMSNMALDLSQLTYEQKYYFRCGLRRKSALALMKS